MSKASIGFMIWRVSSRDSKNTNPATTTTREQRGHEHLTQEGEQGMTGFGQADDASIGELLGGIHRIGAQGFPVAR